MTTPQHRLYIVSGSDRVVKLTTNKILTQCWMTCKWSVSRSDDFNPDIQQISLTKHWSHGNHWRLDKFHSLSGHSGKEKVPSLPGIESQSLDLTNHLLISYQAKAVNSNFFLEATTRVRNNYATACRVLPPHATERGRSLTFPTSERCVNVSILSPTRGGCMVGYGIVSKSYNRNWRRI